MLKIGLPPVARDDARLLILGSLPGDASLVAGRYYAHRQNHFWKLVGSAIDRDLHAMDYQDRLATLQTAGIALWDVVGEAVRPGSLDHKIRNAQINDLESLARPLPSLRAIAFNGKKAAALGMAAFDGTELDLIALPSSSPAYTLAVTEKMAAWSAISRYVLPLDTGYDAILSTY